MQHRTRLTGLVAVALLFTAADLLACGDKFLVAGRGTRYQRPKNARAASVLIYAAPSSGLPDALKSVPVESLLKRQGHRSTTAETLDQLSALVTGGRFDVILAANSVAAAIEKLLAGVTQPPVVVAFCIKASGQEPQDTGPRAVCTVKTPPKERSLLEAIDKAVERHDRIARKAARG
jgi:hypothetical protein